MSANLYAAFERHFPTDRSKLLLTAAGGLSSTYDDADRKSAQVANLLIALGLKPGDRVTVQAKKSPELLWLFLGAVRAGMVFHPLNSAYVADELEYFLSDAEPSLVVCDTTRESEFTRLCDKTGVATLLTLNADGTGTLTEGSSACSEQFETVDSLPDDLVSLVYSSGTTGHPKGVMLSHENLASNIRTLVACWDFTADDCLLHALPVFHVHGLFVATGCVLMSGASMRWLPKFDVTDVISNLPHSTVMMGVPTFYTRLLAESSFGAEVCKTVRLFVSGSAPLLTDTFNAFEARTGQTILERYGMTETCMNTSNPLHGERRAGTVGLPLPGVRVRVAGTDHQPVRPGEVGDLEVKGPNVFRGYWKSPDRTAREFTDDGFFVTGDKGQIDSDGYVTIVGRARDMVITGGLNVYPKEIELLIDELPGVLESAVIGLPDPDFGEAVAAVVVPEPGADLSGESVERHVRQHAAGFKVPKKVFIVDSLPRNAMGKVQKNQLRETCAPDHGIVPD